MQAWHAGLARPGESTEIEGVSAGGGGQGMKKKNKSDKNTAVVTLQGYTRASDRSCSIQVEEERGMDVEGVDRLREELAER